jgi:hypothetical protein
MLGNPGYSKRRPDKAGRSSGHQLRPAQPAKVFKRLDSRMGAMNLTGSLDLRMGPVT